MELNFPTTEKNIIIRLVIYLEDVKIKQLRTEGTQCGLKLCFYVWLEKRKIVSQSRNAGTYAYGQKMKV